LAARFAASDPRLHAELWSGPRNESAGWLQAGSRPLALSLEAMVSIGRPAFLVQDDAIVFEGTEAAAKTVVARLQDARAQIVMSLTSSARARWRNLSVSSVAARNAHRFHDGAASRIRRDGDVRLSYFRVER
jgi:hypothetical protein